MQIEVNCPQCTTRLRISQEYAGKQVSCPQCNVTFTIPSANPPVISTSNPAMPSQANLWRIRVQDGTEYGPIEKNELDSWVNENRITVNDFLLPESGTEWVAASSVYPNLASVAAPGGFSEFDFENQSTSSASDNPFASASPTGFQQSTGKNSGMRKERDRGTLILVLGILGFVTCPLLGIAAWVMGNADLAKMRVGRMETQGKSNTELGRILGIINTSLLCIGIAFYFLLISAFILS